ncbi:Toxin with endonuclease activity YhaV [Cylindrospermum stagnale PCC 7417]|uniref:Toxin with endonuclease activity YhaV n=1 Tax=Cylindrospermum stagnale PCC 7417 TaxID=56107 RepID=K9X2N6_9NOST|nr:type II toxin-antitoxin system YhaV family toxin [Cylindrospermum stagnale]AFZ26321.1 Toxin with endonuclease activity YhaV [Cylindrospermum stagnale PCC 7417]
MNVNGWTLKIHPAFGEQYQKLINQVEQLKEKNPEEYQMHPATKLLNNITELIFKRIPEDPTAPEFRQGKTLGTERKHWFRAKFNRRFRLFFRYSTAKKIIIYAWVNDEFSLRKEGSKTDPYQIFTKMLENGNPPDSWDELLNVSNNLELFSEDPE